MEVIIRWVVDYILTSCPVWRGTLPQNQSDYNVAGRLGILLSETGKDTGSYIGIPSTIYEHSNLYTNTVIEIGSAQTFH